MALTENSVRDFLVDFNTINPELVYTEIIGRQHYLDIAMSAANPADSRLGGKYNRCNPAYLLYGRSGSGRSTLDTSIGLMLLDMVTKLGEPVSNFRWYHLPDGALDGDSADEICQNINLLFDAVEADMKNDDYFVSLSLGSLSSVIRKKRAARLFAKRLGAVINSPQTCLVTAVFGEDISLVTEEIRRQFLPLRLTDPDCSQREQYLTEARSMHPMISWEMPVGEMAELTDGFTFGMLKSVVNTVFSLACGMIINGGGNVEDYLFITDNAPLAVPAESIAFAIENAAAPSAKAEAQAVSVPVVQYIPAPATPEQAALQEEQLPPEQESSKPDKPSEIENMLQTLTPPVALDHGQQ